MEREDYTRLTVWQFLLLVLSVYVLAALFVETAFPISDEVKRVIQVSDTAICIAFLFDFFYRLIAAPDKLRFLKWGWIDLVSSIPMLDVFRWGRLVRIIRVLRILRAFRSTKMLIQFFVARKAKSALASVILISFTLVVFSSIAILNVEKAPTSNIKDADDALWWAFVTVTTVGYGDKYPVTPEGRFLGVLLMVAGVGMFGAFTGYVASWIVGDIEKHEDVEQRQILERLDRIEKTLKQLIGKNGG